MTVKHPLNLKLKHIRWRNAAYHFVAENGPSTIERIFENLTNKLQPKSKQSASQLLRRDERFTHYYAETKGIASFVQSTGEQYKVLTFEVEG